MYKQTNKKVCQAALCDIEPKEDPHPDQHTPQLVHSFFFFLVGDDDVK